MRLGIAFHEETENSATPDGGSNVLVESGEGTIEHVHALAGVDRAGQGQALLLTAAKSESWQRDCL